MDIKIMSLVAVLLIGLTARAETKQLNSDDIVDVEELYKNSLVPPPPPPKPVAPPAEKPVLTDQEKTEIQNMKKNDDSEDSEMRRLTDLNRLAPFSDVSMIQRKFLPKSERFQVYGALGLSTNSPWFINAGGKINFGYNFTEKFGLEASLLFLSSSERDAAKDIRENNSLQPERFILTKSNVNLDLVWSPIYGKITKLNQEIIPFDMYFSLGGGMSETNSAEKNVATGHISTGQIFAMSKSMAFRWDYSCYIYQATPVQDSISSSAPVKSTYEDLVFTAGVSFFFPEANYR